MLPVQHGCRCVHARYGCVDRSGLDDYSPMNIGGSRQNMATPPLADGRVSQKDSKAPDVSNVVKTERLWTRWGSRLL